MKKNENKQKDAGLCPFKINIFCQAISWNIAVAVTHVTLVKIQQVGVFNWQEYKEKEAENFVHLKTFRTFG